MNVVAYGGHAVLVECRSPAQALAVALRLAAPALDGVEDVVPAARTVLVRSAHTSDRLAADVDERLRGWTPAGTPVPAAAGEQVEIAVHYDGADLAAVAAATGLTPDEVVALHSGAVHTVVFCGFAPGFGYLVGLPAELVLPRRATPRPMVPAGSLAIAGEFSGVYPTASPGGWHLLGHTDRRMFDPAADRPAVLAPGDSVRFVRA